MEMIIYLSAMDVEWIYQLLRDIILILRGVYGPQWEFFLYKIELPNEVRV